MFTTANWNTDLWRRAPAHLADPYPSESVLVVTEAVRSCWEAGDGISFVPVHGDVEDGDGSEGDMGVVLRCTCMTGALSPFAGADGSTAAQNVNIHSD